MPNLNFNIDDALMQQIRIKAAQANKTRKEWLIESLHQVVAPVTEPQGEPVAQEAAQ